MPKAGDISEDRGFKALVTTYPVETIEVFVPELLAERGKPTSTTVLQQESSLPELAKSSRFLDVAILATWTDGSMAVILLVEHWSQARKIDLRRVNWYVADLALRNPNAVVYPVLLVTDSDAQAIADRWEMTAAGVTTLALQVRVYRVTAAELPRLRSLQNRVAAILTALAMRDAVEAVVCALEQMERSPGPYDDIQRFLPFAMKLARMPASDRPRFRQRLKEAGMENLVLIMEVEALNKGRAEGRVEGRVQGQAEELDRVSRVTVASFRRLVDRGILSSEDARAELKNLMDSGGIAPAIGQEALSSFT